jgi:hypothetical protein
LLVDKVHAPTLSGLCHRSVARLPTGLCISVISAAYNARATGCGCQASFVGMGPIWLPSRWFWQPAVPKDPGASQQRINGLAVTKRKITSPDTKKGQDARGCARGIENMCEAMEDSLGNTRMTDLDGSMRSLTFSGGMRRYVRNSTLGCVATKISAPRMPCDPLLQARHSCMFDDICLVDNALPIARFCDRC